MIKLKYNLNQNGFTLIEIGISILILSVALLAIAEMQIIAMRGSSFANRLSQSTAFAQDRVESLMLLAYDDPKLDDVTPIESFTTHSAIDSPIGYDVKWHVNANLPSDGKKTINVDVSWQAMGRISSFTIAFIKSQF